MVNRRLYQFSLVNPYRTLTLNHIWVENRKKQWLERFMTLVEITINGRKKWAKPLREMHKLSCLDHVERLCIWADPSFTIEQFNSRRTLLAFSALNNLQELRIERLLLSGFIPKIKLYFGHFAPTLQSLTLWRPQASCRQILYFVGLFKELRDLKLVNFGDRWEDEIPATLTPLSRPPLDGWLTLGNFSGEKFVVDMIALYGKLRFRSVSLWKVQHTRRVLDECADTLETLQLTLCEDCYGKNLFRWKGKG